MISHGAELKETCRKCRSDNVELDNFHGDHTAIEVELLYTCLDCFHEWGYTITIANMRECGEFWQVAF